MNQAQIQQQRFLQQQAHARQALFMGQNAMVNGMPMGMPINQMNPAQLAAFRQGIRPVRDVRTSTDMESLLTSSHRAPIRTNKQR